MFFKRKESKQDKLEIQTHIQFYGEPPEEDMIIFAGMADENIQKEEHVWLSLQLVTALFEGKASRKEIGEQIEKQATDCVYERYRHKKEE